MTAEILATCRNRIPMATYSRRKRQLEYSAISHIDQRKPLSGKAVFLDLSGSRKIASFKDDIVSLGARVETFLSKHIHFLITNHPRPASQSADPKKCDSSELSHSPSVQSTPSPFNSTRHSPTTCHDQATPSVSRGKAILQKAHVKSQATSVVENALKWGVKVVYFDTAQKWVDREKEKRKRLDGTKSPNSRNKVIEQRKKSANLPVIVRRLNAPYVKFESNRRDFRPMLSEFDKWPSVNVDTPRGSCPFDGRHAVNDQQKDRGLNATLSTTETMRTRDYSRTPTLGGANDSCDMSHIVTVGDVERATQLRRKIARKKGYCECCKVSYDDIDVHVQSCDHQSFVRDETNFHGLSILMSQCSDPRRFIESLPTPVSAQYNSTHLTPSKCKRLSRSPQKRATSATFVKLSPSLQNATHDARTRNITLDVRTPSKSLGVSMTKHRRTSTRLPRSFSANFIQTLGPLVPRFQPASDGVERIVSRIL